MKRGEICLQQKIRHVSSNADELRMYELREKGERDYRSGLNFARREGMQRGMERGIQRGRLAALQTSARKMKALGMSLEQIHEITGLTAAEIKKLL